MKWNHFLFLFKIKKQLNGAYPSEYLPNPISLPTDNLFFNYIIQFERDINYRTAGARNLGALLAYKSKHSSASTLFAGAVFGRIQYRNDYQGKCIEQVQRSSLNIHIQQIRKK